MRPEQNDPPLYVGVVKVKKVANFEALCSNLSLFNKAALIYFRTYHSSVAARAMCCRAKYGFDNPDVSQPEKRPMHL